MAATTTYLSLGAFYAADKRRDISREHDLGLWWLGDDWHAPRFRAAWVAQTGELYLMQHEGTPGGGRVDVVATASSLEEIESASTAGATSSASGARCTGCASASASRDGREEPPRFERPVAADVRRHASWPSSAQGTSTESSVGESRATT